MKGVRNYRLSSKKHQGFRIFLENIKQNFNFSMEKYQSMVKKSCLKKSSMISPLKLADSISTRKDSFGTPILPNGLHKIFIVEEGNDLTDDREYNIVIPVTLNVEITLEQANPINKNI